MIDRPAFVRDPFYRLGYPGRSNLITAGMLRQLPLLATDWWPARSPAYRGGWGLGLAGMGVMRFDGHRGWKQISPHRPPLYVKALGPRGTLASFGRPAAGPGFGQWDGELHYRDRFIDVVAAAYALDGIDDDDFARHAEAFGLPAEELPLAVSLDADGAEELIRAVDQIAELALRVDAEAARWCGGIGLHGLTSPAGVARAVLDDLGARSRPRKPNRRTQVEHDARWAEATHGGWVTAEMAGVDPRQMESR